MMNSFLPRRSVISFANVFLLGVVVSFFILRELGIGAEEIHVVVDANKHSSSNTTLLNYFRNNKKKEIHKWLHYFELYERHLDRFRDTDVTILEIGVAQGGSLQMWKEYFGAKAQIIGADIDENTRNHAEEQIDIMIGDQADPTFLKSIMAKYPKIDIVIDDGGHTMKQQITSFEYLFPHVSKNGVYLCEDTHTSYWSEFGGGLRREGTFVGMAKGLTDHLNSWHFRDSALKTEMDFTRSVHSMHFYNSMIVFEKRPQVEPRNTKRGSKTIKDYYR